MDAVDKKGVSRRSFLGLLAAAAAFLLARLPGRRNDGKPTKARFWRRLGDDKK
ncbi:MAG TPA: hypothetical protein VMX79_00635 [bacterium]|nr:hypothetical protein [bacterium]